jgi:hypothetical protein
VNINAPLSTNRSAYSDCVRRNGNRSMTKHCINSCRGRPDFFARFSSYPRTEAGMSRVIEAPLGKDASFWQL